MKEKFIRMDLREQQTIAGGCLLCMIKESLLWLVSILDRLTVTCPTRQENKPVETDSLECYSLTYKQQLI